MSVSFDCKIPLSPFGGGSFCKRSLCVVSSSMVQPTIVQRPTADARLHRILPAVEHGKATIEAQTLHGPNRQCRVLLRRLGKLRSRQRIVRPNDRLEKIVQVVRENLRLLPPACQGNIGRPLVGCRERFAGDADEDLVHGNALAGMACDDISVAKMAEIPVNDPAVIDDDVAAFGKSLDRNERAVAQAMLAVLCLAAGRDPNPIANAQGQLRRPVRLEPIGKLGRRFDRFAYDQARSFFVARCILMKLEQVAGLVLGCVRFLGIGEVSRSPYLDDTFIVKFAFCLEASTNRLR